MMTNDNIQRGKSAATTRRASDNTSKEVARTAPLGTTKTPALAR
jgi:hypothetical protein